jgi:hypothetical protein
MLIDDFDKKINSYMCVYLKLIIAAKSTQYKNSACKMCFTVTDFKLGYVTNDDGIFVPKCVEVI